MAGLNQITTKVLSNGTRIFSEEIVEKGIRKIKTSVIPKKGMTIQRLKTIESQEILGTKINTVTRHYFGPHALGEAFTQGRYNIDTRVYGYGGLLKEINLDTTPTYLEKYGTFSGLIKDVAGEHPTWHDLTKSFEYNVKTGKLDLGEVSIAGNSLPVAPAMDTAERSLVKHLVKKLNFMNLKTQS